jgi:hypothetical protein
MLQTIKIIAVLILSLATFNRITGSGTAPTVTALAALGTGGTITVVGNDMAGTITVTPGTSPSGGSFIRLTYATAYTTGIARVQITAASANAASVMNRVLIQNQDSNLFELSDSGSGLTAGTYVWNYLVTGYQP